MLALVPDQFARQWLFFARRHTNTLTGQLIECAAGDFLKKCKKLSNAIIETIVTTHNISYSILYVVQLAAFGILKTMHKQNPDYKSKKCIAMYNISIAMRTVSITVFSTKHTHTDSTRYVTQRRVWSCYTALHCVTSINLWSTFSFSTHTCSQHTHGIKLF